MSKKKFIEGMDSLFGESTEETLQEKVSLLPDEESKRASSEKRSSASTKSKASSKDFSNDLSSFLTEAFEESFERQLASAGKESRQKKDPPIRRKRPRSMSGLDALIRSTVDPSKIDLENRETKRVSLVVDIEKLKKLKEIARVERTYLKDIIDEIVGEYIQRYRKNK